jgi:phosphopantothenoylcysteine synthetase/decarboxylase
LYQHTHITLTKCIIQSSAFSIIAKMPSNNEDSDESSSSDEDDQNELVEDEEDDDDDDDEDDDEDEPEQDREPRQGMHWHHEPEEVRLDG